MPNATSIQMGNTPSSVFQQALEKYQRDIVKPSTKGDQTVFQKATMTDAIDELKSSARKCAKESRTRRCLARVQPFFDVLNRYGSVIDTCIQFDPKPSALIWGGLKLICKVAGDYSAYFANLIEMIEDLGRHLPRLELYERLFAEDRLKEVLFETYTCIFQFVGIANRAFSTSGFKVLIKSLWKPLTKQLQDTKNALAKIIELADLEVHAISASNIKKEQTAQVEERARAQAERGLQQAERDQQRQERLRSREQREAARQIEQEQKRANEEKVRGEVMAWFNRSDTGEIFADAISKHATNPDSCNWIYNTSEYRQWAADTLQVENLWLHSGPGTGKTILASHITRTMRSHVDTINQNGGKAAIAFFFVSSVSSREGPSAIVRSIVCQLLDYMPAMPIKAIEIHRQGIRGGYGNASHLQMDQLLAFLINIIQELDSTTIIFDGLDECEERSSLLEFCSKLGSNTSVQNLRILVTSRAESDIQLKLSHFSQFKMRPSDTKRDLISFITSAVSGIADLGDEKQLSTVKALSKKASGLFIWVRLVIDLLKDAATPSEFDEILMTIPKGLHQIYCVVIERVHRKLSSLPLSRKMMAKDLLRWLALAPRPLRIDEIREAMATAAMYRLPDQHLKSSQLWAKQIQSLQPSHRAILAICGTMVDHNDADDTVRLLHHTLREFLTNKNADWGRNEIVMAYTVDIDMGHALLSEECLFNILSPHVSDTCNNSIWPRLYELTSSYDDSVPRQDSTISSSLVEIRTEVRRLLPLFDYNCRQFSYHLARVPLVPVGCGLSARRLFKRLRAWTPLSCWLLGWLIFHPYHRFPQAKHFRRLKMYGRLTSKWLARMDIFRFDSKCELGLYKPHEIKALGVLCQMLPDLETSEAKWVLEYGLGNHKQHQYEEAFIRAVNENELQAAQFLISMPSWKSRHWGLPHAALRRAVRNQNAKMVEIISRRENDMFDPEEKNSKWQSQVQWSYTLKQALEMERWEVVEALLDGLDEFPQQFKRRYYQLVFQKAVESQQDQVVQRLFSRAPGWYDERDRLVLLKVAIKAENLALVETILGQQTGIFKYNEVLGWYHNDGEKYDVQHEETWALKNAMLEAISNDQFQMMHLLLQTPGLRRSYEAIGLAVARAAENGNCRILQELVNMESTKACHDQYRTLVREIHRERWEVADILVDGLKPRRTIKRAVKEKDSFTLKYLTSRWNDSRLAKMAISMVFEEKSWRLFHQLLKWHPETGQAWKQENSSLLNTTGLGFEGEGQQPFGSGADNTTRQEPKNAYLASTEVDWSPTEIANWARTQIERRNAKNMRREKVSKALESLERTVAERKIEKAGGEEEEEEPTWI